MGRLARWLDGAMDLQSKPYVCVYQGIITPNRCVGLHTHTRQYAPSLFAAAATINSRDLLARNTLKSQQPKTMQLQTNVRNTSSRKVGSWRDLRSSEDSQAKLVGALVRGGSSTIAPSSPPHTNAAHQRASKTSNRRRGRGNLSLATGTQTLALSLLILVALE